MQTDKKADIMIHLMAFGSSYHFESPYAKDYKYNTHINPLFKAPEFF